MRSPIPQIAILGCGFASLGSVGCGALPRRGKLSLKAGWSKEDQFGLSGVNSTDQPDSLKRNAANEAGRWLVMPTFGRLIRLLEGREDVWHGEYEPFLEYPLPPIPSPLSQVQRVQARTPSQACGGPFYIYSFSCFFC